MTRLANQSGEQLHNIRQQVRQAATLVGTMASFSTEQASAIQHIYQAMQQMDLVTQQNAHMVEENNQTAIKLQTESTLLKQIINRFQIKRERNESTTSRKDDDSTVADSVVATTLALPAPKT